LRRAGQAGGRHPRSRDKDADHVSLKKLEREDDVENTIRAVATASR
jgi:hypothetical protein